MKFREFFETQNLEIFMDHVLEYDLKNLNINGYKVKLNLTNPKNLVEQIMNYAQHITKLGRDQKATPKIKMVNFQNTPSNLTLNLQFDYGYEDIYFNQNEDEGFDILRNDGEDAVIDHLRQWHYPGEHRIQDQPSFGSADDIYEKGNYVLAYNRRLGYMGLENHLLFDVNLKFTADKLS